MHGITHLLSHHHGSGSHNHDSKSSATEPSKKSYQVDAKLIQELSNLHKPDGKLYLNDRQASRGSVSSTYSYGSATSYGSSHGSSSSNYGSGNPFHHQSSNQSVYHTIHGNDSHSSSSYHHPLYTIHHAGNQHHHHPSHHHHRLHHQQSLLGTSSGATSPISVSPTGEPERHHHHHSIQEMIRYFGRRIGHIRRQSECQDTPKEKEEEFRNRSQSLDGSARPPTFEPDCETTYRIYESILRQGNTEIGGPCLFSDLQVTWCSYQLKMTANVDQLK